MEPTALTNPRGDMVMVWVSPERRGIQNLEDWRRKQRGDVAKRDGLELNCRRLTVQRLDI